MGLGIQPTETIAEVAHLPPQLVESFRFLRAGKGLEIRFSHLPCSELFSCFGSKTIICSPTWHAWCVIALRMIETNVDSQL